MSENGKGSKPSSKLEKPGLLERMKEGLSDKSTRWRVVIIVGLLITWFSLSITPSVSFENDPIQLWVNAPSYAKKGETFDVTVEAWDWSERLSKNYKGEVSFSLMSYDLSSYEPISDGITANVPDNYKFDGTAIDMGGIPPSWVSGDAGCKSFDMSISSEGIHYLVVEDDLGFKAVSNPILVNEETETKKLLWGDIHSHSIISDGSGLPPTLFNFARKTALLDFYSLTDHGEGTGITAFERARWRENYVRDQTEKYNDPGEFVTFHGTEWTTNFGLVGGEFGYGHYTVVSDSAATVDIARGKQTNHTQLWDYLDEYTAENDANVLALPHHLTQTNFEMDWLSIDPEYVKTASIFSVHGASLLSPMNENNHLGTVHVHEETEPGAPAVDAYKMGFRGALVANSDSHDGHPGHAICHKATHYPDQYPVLSWTPRYGHPYPGGLTGVWVDNDNFDRKGIMSSIRAGKTIATRAPFRAIVNFSINGIRPGEVSRVNVSSQTAPRNINLNIFRDGLENGWDGNGTINDWDDLTVEIWKNSEIWHNFTTNSPVVKKEIVDTESITGASYDNWVYDEETDKYYQNNRSIVGVDDVRDMTSDGEDYYFIRCYQGDGSMENFYSWIGPIWVGWDEE